MHTYLLYVHVNQIIHVGETQAASPEEACEVMIADYYQHEHQKFIIEEISHGMFRVTTKINDFLLKQKQ